MPIAALVTSGKTSCPALSQRPNCTRGSARHIGHAPLLPGVDLEGFSPVAQDVTASARMPYRPAAIAAQPGTIHSVHPIPLIRFVIRQSYVPQMPVADLRV